jgi:hypothetical protein
MVRRRRTSPVFLLSQIKDLRGFHAVFAPQLRRSAPRCHKQLRRARRERMLLYGMAVSRERAHELVSTEDARQIFASVPNWGQSPRLSS